jgi:C-1 hydroxylase
MTPEENKRRVLALCEAVNAHDLEGIDGFTTNPDIAGVLHRLLTAFPDLHLDVRWALAEQDRVVVFLDLSGTQDGPWLMVTEPTHRPIQTSMLVAYQLDDDGMLVDTWLGTNFIAMLAQLGWGVAPEGQPVPTT